MCWELAATYHLKPTFRTIHKPHCCLILKVKNVGPSPSLITCKMWAKTGDSANVTR